MYLGNDYNFNSLDSFISGFALAASEKQLELNDCPNFRFFSTWLISHFDKHYGLSGGWHWQIKSRYPNDDKKSFDEFFCLLHIFKGSKTHSKSIIIDKEALEGSESGSVKPYTTTDGKEKELNTSPFKIIWKTIDNSTAVWLDYLDETGNYLHRDIWRIDKAEALTSLAAEFGTFTNSWIEVS